jgi:hypothetical protein
MLWLARKSTVQGIVRVLSKHLDTVSSCLPDPTFDGSKPRSFSRHEEKGMEF